MNKKVQVDHLGNEFDSRQDMCDYWNIPLKTYESRLYKKWTLEKCLTMSLGIRLNQQTYTDHENNVFKSLSDMAKHWNIAESTLQARIVDKKMSIKDALTLTEADMHFLNHKFTDHLGNVFASKSKMCKHWNIPTQVYFGRISLGWSIKDSLETPVTTVPNNAKQVKDHEGNTFESVSKMCKHWNMTRSTYNARLKKGYTIKDALTKPIAKINVTKKQKWTDHLGNNYDSMNQMCDKYNITHHTFKTRLDLGWSIEDALTKPNVIHSKEITDYCGRIFPTIADFCHFYNMPVYMLHGKNRTDKEIQRLMRLNFKPGLVLDDIKIVKNLDFPYSIVRKNNHEVIYTFEQILHVYHNLNFCPLPETKIQNENLLIKHCIDFPYYYVEHNGVSEIWNYWQIIQHRHDTNFGLSKVQK